MRVPLMMLVLFLGADLAWAHVAVVTRLVGDVKILRDPSDELQGKGPHVLFEGQYYRDHKASMGSKLGNGEVIQVPPKGKARLIFRSGDVISVGPGSSYRIRWQGNRSPVIELLFGRLRAIFKKDGPRADTEVQTRTMVLGVRGTDFYISQRGVAEVVVLRGEVEVADPRGTSAPVKVPSGTSAKIPLTVAKTSNAGRSVVVHRTTKQQLQTVETSTRLPEASTDVIYPQLARLESKAVSNAMDDIQATDPALYEQITAGGRPTDLDAVSSSVVSKIRENAPEEADIPASSRTNYFDDY